MQPAITIPANALTVTIARDGTVTVARPGRRRRRRSARCSSPSFINPAGLQSAGREPLRRDRRVGHADANTPGTNGLGMLSQGYVETSNVNVVEELVNMIQTQRAYEINSKAIQTSDQMLQRLTQL